MGVEGLDSVLQKQRNLPSESGVLRQGMAELVPGFVPSAAIQAWATLINDDERLQDLLMFATSMDQDELDAILAIQRGMLAARKAVRR